VILGSEVIMAFESPFRLALNRWTAWIPTYLICNAEAVRQYVIETMKVPADRAVTVYQGVDVEAYPFRRERRFAHPVLGIVGRLQHQKGYRHLIAAAAIVRRTHADARWIWIGDGPERPQVEALIREHGLEDVIELAGYSGNMAHNLTRFDYYVHPAIAEGMPYAVVEAMAAGLPVVATDVGGTRELIEHGISGFVVPPADHEALAASVLSLLKDPEGARRFGVAARERIRVHFPESNLGEAEERLIRQSLTASRGPRSSRPVPNGRS
jgi:glycosyltransferase involved in cell wall biosynthesis